MSMKSQKDFFSGLLFMTVGVAFAWGATNYNVGTAARMGPGYFPLVLGILVVETEDGEKIGPWAWKPLFFIIAANLMFGLLLGGLPSFHIPAMGLIAAIYALTFIASLAGEEFKFKEVVILATVLAGLSYVTFILLLKLQFAVWPTFITG